MSIDAMKQALEALEEAHPKPYNESAITHVEAIKTLRLAIEQAERQEPVAWGVDWGKAGDIPCVSIIKRLADGGIKVVAVEYAPYAYTTPPQQPMVVSQECAERGCMAHDDRVDGPGVVLERQWAGLTDEEIDKTYESQVWDARRSYARAIEAKLKEKNT